MIIERSQAHNAISSQRRLKTYPLPGYGSDAQQMGEQNGVGATVSHNCQSQHVRSRRRIPNLKPAGFFCMHAVWFQHLLDGSCHAFMESMKRFATREACPMLIERPKS